MYRGYVAVVSFLFLTAAPAWGGGVILPSTGTKAQGMAGAWIAQGDDVNAIDHNPAGLTRQDRIAAEVNYTAYVYRARFDGAPVAGIGDPPPVSNDRPAIRHVPNAYAAFPIKDKWVIGVGAFSPVGPANVYADWGPQRYQVQEFQISLVWVALHAAWQMFEQLSISAGIDVGYPWATQKIGLAVIPGFFALDGSVIVDGTGKLAPRGKFGLVWEPREHLFIGAAAAHKVTFRVGGSVVVDLPQAGLSPDDPASSDKIEASQIYPAEARLAIGWLDDTWRAELAGRYYRWSKFTEIAIDLKNNEIAGIAFPDLTLPKSYRDSLTVQLGGGYRFAEHHELRVGYMYDMFAAKDARVQVSDADANKHLLGLGYTLDFDRIYGSVAWNRVFFPTRRITSSEAEAIALIGEPPVIGNGDLDWSIDMFSINAGVRF